MGKRQTNQVAWGDGGGAVIEIKHKKTGELLVRVAAKTLVNADLHRANLRGADLRGAALQNTNLSHVSSDDRHREWGPLPTATDAQFRGADLADADLSGANLTGADLTGANLQRATLVGANLQRATLALTDLRDADLRHVNMEDACVAGCDLTSANLMSADLTGIDLLNWVCYGEGWSRQNDLTGAVYDQHTRWPSGFDPVKAGAVKAEE
jgi:uncharacterized protein YjbI with pentapeptide repeats